MRLPPLPMRPHYVEKIWGGSRLAALPAKQRPGHRPPAEHGAGIGESWEVADIKEGHSFVDDDAICGDFAGVSLTAMVKRFGHELVGTAHAPDRFPILVKLIDAAEDLSVQVHPGDDWAHAHPGSFSKDEAWRVIDTAVGGRVLHGFIDGVSRALFADAVRMGLPHELLRSIAVKRGDVLHVAPGTVHAIGAGVVVLEVQEPSDTTFRVWDFNRKENGKPRALHLEEALAVAHFSDTAPQPAALCVPRVDARGTVLVESRRFTMKSLAVNGAEDVAVGKDTAVVVYVEDGEAGVTLQWHEQSCLLPRGASCILPASCGGVRLVAVDARVILMH